MCESRSRRQGCHIHPDFRITTNLLDPINKLLPPTKKKALSISNRPRSIHTREKKSSSAQVTKYLPSPPHSQHIHIPGQQHTPAANHLLMSLHLASAHSTRRLVSTYLSTKRVARARATD